MRLFGLFLLLGFAAIGVQMLYPLSWDALFVAPCFPMLVLSLGALLLSEIWVLWLVVILGLVVDLCSPNRIGVSMISFGIAAALIVSQRRSVQRERAGYRLLLVLVGTFLFMMVDYLLFCLQTHHWRWTLMVWNKMLYPSMWNMALSPILYYGLRLLAVVLDCWHEREFAEEYARP